MNIKKSSSNQKFNIVDFYQSFTMYIGLSKESIAISILRFLMIKCQVLPP
jgi:hypothetical protein